MKILQITAFFSPEYGGSAEAPYQLSRTLVHLGHEVDIYSSHPDTARTNYQLPPGARFFGFKKWLGLGQFFVTPGMFRRLALDIGRYEIIHCHNLWTFQNIVVHYFAKKHGIPYIIQAHGSVSTYFQRGFFKNIYHRVWGNRILKDASAVIALTPVESGQYLKYGVNENKIQVVPNGVDKEEYSCLPDKGTFRKRYGIRLDLKLVLFLARINKIKGLDILIQSFDNLIDELPDIILVIAGPDDGYLPTLKKMIKSAGIENNVLLTGPLFGRDKLEAFADADVYVLPSSYEIFGISLIEAMACGTPVVMTDRCGLAGLVANSAGIVVPYEPEALQRALATMLTDDDLRERYAANGRQLVSEKFDWETIGHQMEKIYASLATNGRR